MAKTHIQGLKALQVNVNGLSDETITKLLKEACILVQDDARIRCPKSSPDEGFRDGSLAASIDHEVEGDVGVVGTNKFYAPFVHQGTGKYAVDGNGRQGYWVYVKDGTPGYTAKNPGKIYTLEEAKQVVAMMKADGLDAYYTNGQRSQPFLTDALDANEDKIMEIFENAVKENL